MNKKEFVAVSEKFIRRIVKLSVELPKDKIGQQAKNELISNSTTASSQLNQIQWETNKESIEIQNHIINLYGKLKFWIDFLYEEGYLDEFVSKDLLTNLNGLITNLINIKKEDLKLIPASYDGEWFLDD